MNKTKPRQSVTMTPEAWEAVEAYGKAHDPPLSRSKVLEGLARQLMDTRKAEATAKAHDILALAMELFDTISNEISGATPRIQFTRDVRDIILEPAK